MLRRPSAERFQPQEDRNAEREAEDIESLRADRRLRRVEPGGAHDDRVERTGHRAAVFAERSADGMDGKADARELAPGEEYEKSRRKNAGRTLGFIYDEAKTASVIPSDSSGISRFAVCVMRSAVP